MKRIFLTLLLLTISISCNNPKDKGVTSTAHESKTKEHPLVKITRGNERFRSGQAKNTVTTLKDLKVMSQSQHPHTVVVSCSDSRVEPGIVLDQGLGELFVIRTAGQALGKNVIASIEFAVENLGAEQIIVMGHTQCGAVEAALGALEGQEKPTPALRALVQDIAPRLTSFKDKKHTEGLTDESWANADGVARDLIERSEVIKNRVESGRLQITSSLYFFDSGVLEIKDPKKLDPKFQAQEEGR
jgi:carbonic anhydrase